jgi:UDP-N-acetylglucosamine diphosphorylase / glucose-1-phosphate thymidylyltransferase / UDP-N-acetylgalactosamine diphosphorylase / glucosamine-1-phosphate N-acetyltransferase / galactosamine-1-phosphate N-acetyltransferase
MTSKCITDSLIRRYVLKTNQVIHPFESPATKLPVLNKTVFEHQEDVFRNLKIKEEPVFISSLEEITQTTSQTLVYSDDIYFNKELVLKFIEKASAIGKPASLAFSDTDPCFSVHACYPQHNMEHVGNLYMGDFFFIPAGVQDRDLISIKRDFIPVIIDTESKSLPCFSSPALELGCGQRQSNNPLSKVPPLHLQVPQLSYIAIKHWTQLLFANFTWGIHSQMYQLCTVLENKNTELRKMSSDSVKRRGPINIGKDCQIDPTATIIGPTTIGDGVVIGPNVTIIAGHIGDYAVLEPSCTIWFGVLGARSSLLANRNLIMSCVMNDSIINTDIRFSIVGNNSFLGAGSVITDCILRNADESDPNVNSTMVKVLAGKEIVNSGYYVLGPAIGNRVKIGSGVIVYPGRMIKSGSLILPGQGYNVVDR